MINCANQCLRCFRGKGFCQLPIVYLWNSELCNHAENRKAGHIHAHAWQSGATHLYFVCVRVKNRKFAEKPNDNNNNVILWVLGDVVVFLKSVFLLILPAGDVPSFRAIDDGSVVVVAHPISKTESAAAIVPTERHWHD